MFIIDGDTHPPKLLNHVILSAAKDLVLLQYMMVYVHVELHVSS